VQDKDKYNFHPKKLLQEIIATILHFASFPEFEVAMVKDERSFDEANLRKAVRVLSSGADSMRPEELAALETFTSRCLVAKQEMEENEAELGDVPDEFLDPITAELMEDPVKLPSGHSIDRPSISRHLLSDETDPFSRARCTLEMLVDDVELKQRIGEWKAQKKAEWTAAKKAAKAAQANAQGADDAVPMDED
jgi:ubiquitin conjugation factor E4 B